MFTDLVIFYLPVLCNDTRNLFIGLFESIFCWVMGVNYNFAASTRNLTWATNMGGICLNHCIMFFTLVPTDHVHLSLT